MSKVYETVFCINCDEKVPYDVTTRDVTISVRGISFTFTEQVARCAHCGEEIYVPSINDANCQAQEDAYREAANLI